MNPEEIVPEVPEEIVSHETMDTEKMDRVIELLENIELNHAKEALFLQDYGAVFFDTARTILTYGLVIVPLVFVVTMLWWFFKQFLHKY